MCLDGTDKGREAFSKIKGLVRKAEARTKEALVEAIGLALSAVTSTEILVISSSTVAIGCRFNHYGERCSGRLGTRHIGVGSLITITEISEDC